MRFNAVAAVMLAAAALLAVGCGEDATTSNSNASSSGGDGGSEAVQVDVGLEQPIELPQTPKVGYFAFGTANEWLQLLLKTTEEKANEYGWELKVYDAAFDPTKQLNQIQNAIQRDNLNAAVILPVSGALECDAVSKDMSAAGIVTVVQTVPICGKEKGPVTESHVPGILTFVGSQDNVPFNEAWLKAAAEEFSGPQNVALIMGPEIVEQAIAVKAALPVLEDYPDFKVNHQEYTDYTTGTTLKQVRALLRKDPEIDVILSVYSPDQTRGVLQALEEEGKLGQVKVADIGATKWTYEQMEAGNIHLTVPLMPLFTAGYAMDAIKQALDGEEVEGGIVDLTTSEEEPIVITPDNMSDYDPQY